MKLSRKYIMLYSWKQQILTFNWFTYFVAVNYTACTHSPSWNFWNISEIFHEIFHEIHEIFHEIFHAKKFHVILHHYTHDTQHTYRHTSLRIPTKPKMRKENIRAYTSAGDAKDIDARYSVNRISKGMVVLGVDGIFTNIPNLYLQKYNPRIRQRCV